MWQTIGQDKIVSMLRRGLEQKTLSHAYVLVGPSHIGKMTLALDLASALNCEAAVKPCGECLPCRKIAGGKHADVQVVSLGLGPDADDARAKTEIGISQIQEIIHSSSLPPFEGIYRVYIVDEAGLLSNEAANCLLKTLEEPTGKVVFILLTTNARLIPATVLSRCQRLELSRVSTATVEEVLVERWKVDREKAKLLARICHGSLGWAVEAAGSPTLLQQRGERFEKLIGFLKGSYSERFDVAAQLASQFGKKREVVYEVLDSWIDWWHDLLLAKTDCHDSIINFDYRAVLDEMARSYDLLQIKCSIQEIRQAAEQLKLNVNARLVLETLMLNLPRTGTGKTSRLGEVTHA
jgi:DNA polymerase III subunit delta'